MFNNAVCLSLAKYSVLAFKLTPVVQFYCDKFNPWLELLQSLADSTAQQCEFMSLWLIHMLFKKKSLADSALSQKTN